MKEIHIKVGSKTIIVPPLSTFEVDPTYVPAIGDIVWMKTQLFEGCHIGQITSLIGTYDLRCDQSYCIHINKSDCPGKSTSTVYELCKTGLLWSPRQC